MASIGLEATGSRESLYTVYYDIETQCWIQFTSERPGVRESERLGANYVEGEQTKVMCIIVLVPLLWPRPPQRDCCCKQCDYCEVGSAMLL